MVSGWGGTTQYINDALKRKQEEEQQKREAELRAEQERQAAARQAQQAEELRRREAERKALEAQQQKQKAAEDAARQKEQEREEQRNRSLQERQASQNAKEQEERKRREQQKTAQEQAASQAQQYAPSKPKPPSRSPIEPPTSSVPPRPQPVSPEASSALQQQRAGERESQTPAWRKDYNQYEDPNLYYAAQAREATPDTSQEVKDYWAPSAVWQRTVDYWLPKDAELEQAPGYVEEFLDGRDIGDLLPHERQALMEQVNAVRAQEDIDYAHRNLPQEGPKTQEQAAEFALSIPNVLGLVQSSTPRGEELRQELIDAYRKAEAAGKDPVKAVMWQAHIQEENEWLRMRRWNNLNLNSPEYQGPGSVPMLIGTMVDVGAARLMTGLAYSGSYFSGTQIQDVMPRGNAYAAASLALLEAMFPGQNISERTIGQVFGATSEIVRRLPDVVDNPVEELMYMPKPEIISILAGTGYVPFDPDAPTLGEKALNVADRWSGLVKSIIADPGAFFREFGKRFDHNLTRYNLIDDLTPETLWEAPFLSPVLSDRIPSTTADILRSQGLASFALLFEPEVVETAKAFSKYVSPDGPTATEGWLKDWILQPQEVDNLRSEALALWERAQTLPPGPARTQMEIGAAGLATKAIQRAGDSAMDMYYDHMRPVSRMAFEFLFDPANLADAAFGILALGKSLARKAGKVGYAVSDAIPAIRPADAIIDQTRRGVGTPNPLRPYRSIEQEIKAVAETAFTAPSPGTAVPFERHVSRGVHHGVAASLMMAENVAKTGLGKAQTAQRYVYKSLVEGALANFTRKGEIKTFFSKVVNDLDGLIRDGIGLDDLIDPVSRRRAMEGGGRYQPGWANLDTPRTRRELGRLQKQPGFEEALNNLPSLRGDPSDVVDKDMFQREVAQMTSRAAGQAYGIDATDGVPFGTKKYRVVDGELPGRHNIELLGEGDVVLHTIPDLSAFELPGAERALKKGMKASADWRRNPAMAAGSNVQSLLSINALATVSGITNNVSSVLAYGFLHTGDPKMLSGFFRTADKAKDFIQSKMGGAIGDIRVAAQELNIPGGTGTKVFWGPSALEKVSPGSKQLRHVRQLSEEHTYNIAAGAGATRAWNEGADRIRDLTVKPMVKEFFKDPQQQRRVVKEIDKIIRNGGGRREVGEMLGSLARGQGRLSVTDYAPNVGHVLSPSDLKQIDEIIRQHRRGNNESTYRQLEELIGRVQGEEVKMLSGGNAPRRYFWTNRARQIELASAIDEINEALATNKITKEQHRVARESIMQWHAEGEKIQNEFIDLLLLTNGNPAETPLVYDAYLAMDNIANEYRVQQAGLRKVANDVVRQADIDLNAGTITKQQRDEAVSAAWTTYREGMEELASEATVARSQTMRGLRAQLAGESYTPTPRPISTPPSALGRDYRTRLQQVFNLPAEQADAVFDVMSARAQAWAGQTGRTADEWFSSRIADIQRGGKPAPGALLQRSHWETPEFKRWFGGSKVVDESGNPKVMYHGTGRHETADVLEGRKTGYTAFDQFKPSEDGLYGPGIYFSDNTNVTGGWYKPDMGTGQPGLEMGYTGFDTGDVVKPWKELKEPVVNLVNDILGQPGGERLTNLRLHNLEERFRRTALDSGVEIPEGWTLVDGSGNYQAQIDEFWAAASNYLQQIDPGGAENRLNELAKNFANMILNSVSREKAIEFNVRQSLFERGAAAGHVYPAYLSVKKPFDIDATYTQKDVFRILGGVAMPPGLPYSENYTSFAAFILDRMPSRVRDKIPGEVLYRAIEQHHPQGTAGVNQLLKMNGGYDGITHIGGGRVGSEAHKVVIAFDSTQVKSAIANVGSYDADDPVILLQKGGKTAGSSRGSAEFLDDNRAILRGFEKADLSTAVHELGHVFRRDLADVAATNADAAADLRVVEDWAGVKAGKWTRTAEEKFARGFERYLRNGVAPSSALAKAFDRFKQWLTDIYQSLRGSAPGRISDEVRAVFDRMFIPDSTQGLGFSPILPAQQPTPRQFAGVFDDAVGQAGRRGPQSTTRAMIDTLAAGGRAEDEIGSLQGFKSSKDAELFERKLQLQDDISKKYQTQAFIALQANPTVDATDEFFSAAAWTRRNTMAQVNDVREAERALDDAVREFGKNSPQHKAAMKNYLDVRNGWVTTHQENWQRWNAAAAIILESAYNKEYSAALSWKPPGINHEHRLLFEVPGNKGTYIVLNTVTNQETTVKAADGFIPGHILDAYKQSHANLGKNLSERLAVIAKQAGIGPTGIADIDKAVAELAKRPGGDALSLLRVNLMEQSGVPGVRTINPTDSVDFTLNTLDGLLNRIVNNLDDISDFNTSTQPAWPDGMLRVMNQVLLPQVDNLAQSASQAGHRFGSRFGGDFTNNYWSDVVMAVFGSYALWSSRFIKNVLEDLVTHPGIPARIASQQRAVHRENMREGGPERNYNQLPGVRYGGGRLDIGGYRAFGPKEVEPGTTYGIRNPLDRALLGPTTVMGRGWSSPDIYGRGAQLWENAPEGIEGIPTRTLGAIMMGTQIMEKVGVGESWILEPIYNWLTGEAVNFSGSQLGGIQRIIGEALVLGEEALLEKDFPGLGNAVGAIARVMVPRYYPVIVANNIIANAVLGAYGDTIDQNNIVAQWAMDVAHQDFFRGKVGPLPEQPAGAEGIYQDARQQTATERIIKNIISFLLPVSITETRPGENLHQYTKEFQAVAGYEPEFGPDGSPVGSKATRNAPYDTVPGYGASKSRYAVTAEQEPGVPDETVRRPGVAAATSEYYVEKEGIPTVQQRREDAFGRYLAGEISLEQAWAEAGAAFNDKKAEDAALKAKYPSVPEFAGRSTYGMNPEEAQQYVQGRIGYDAQARLEERGVLPPSQLHPDIVTGMTHDQAKAAGRDQYVLWLRANDRWKEADAVYDAKVRAEILVMQGDPEYMGSILGGRYLPGPTGQPVKIEPFSPPPVPISDRLRGVEQASGASPTPGLNVDIGATPEEITDSSKFWGPNERAVREQSAAEKAERDAQWQDGTNWAKSRYPEYASNLDEYDSLLPSQQEAYREKNPYIRALTFARNYRSQHEELEGMFGEGIVMKWAMQPPYEEGSTARAEYWRKNPEVFLAHSWINGRPTTDTDNRWDGYNFGKDYAEAVKRFGPEIWDIVRASRAMPAYQEGNRENAALWAKFHEQFPQYKKWRDWWYGNMPAFSGTSSTSRSPFVQWGFGGGWGGGGSRGETSNIRGYNIPSYSRRYEAPALRELEPATGRPTGNWRRWLEMGDTDLPSWRRTW